MVPTPTTEATIAGGRQHESETDGERRMIISKRMNEAMAVAVLAHVQVHQSLNNTVVSGTAALGVRGINHFPENEH